MSVASSAGFVGREAELTVFERLVSSCDEGAAAVLLSGGPGIGKTSVWRASIDRAEAAGMRVLQARCTEVEMPIAFGTLADLLTSVLGETADRLTPRQREALATALGGGGAEAGPVDWLLLAGSALAALRALTTGAPVVVAIDDLQWLDAGSRRVLTYALRRATAAPIVLLATTRHDDADADAFSLADALAPDRFLRIDLAPLSSGALAHLIASRLGVHLSRPTMGRVYRASAGNPMFGLEYARMLVERGRVGEPGPLEVPESLESLVRARVAALPGRLVPLLELASALGRPTLPVLSRAFEDPEAVEELLAEAIAAEVLVLDEDGLVGFAHPLLAAAVYFALPSGRRRAVHRRLAEIVDGLEEQGRHTALGTAEPDVATAALVERAAIAASGRGALDSAAELMGEAVRLTPPSESEARHRRLLAGAGWLVGAGEFGAARERLEPLLGVEVPADVRVDALLLRAECEMADRHRLVELLREALAAAIEPRQRWQALIRLAQHEGWVSGDTPLAADTAAEALELARALADRPLVEASLAAVTFYQAALGSRIRSRRAPDHRRLAIPGRQWWQLSPAVSLGSRLMWAGELGTAREILEHEYGEQDSIGRDAAAGFVLCWLSELEWRAGQWERARELADEATRRLGDVNPTAFPRALVAAGSGRTAETYAIAEAVLAWSEANDERVAPPRFRWLLGLLELSAGDPHRACPLLEEAQALLDAAGIGEPGYLPVLPDLIESLVAVSRAGEAEPLLERLEERAATLSHRFAAAAAQRSRAVLLLAGEDAAPAAALAAGAAQEFAALGMPIERGRALLLAGNALRRLGERRRAAEPLREAAEVFASLGASLWLERAEDELHRASPRPRRDRDTLTAAEVRVARLVAAGHRNKEVAAELYTTVATVEAHLTRIYRKLGIRSRSELARCAADGTLELGPEE